MPIPRELIVDGKAALTLTSVASGRMQTVYSAYSHTSALPSLPAEESHPPPPPPSGPYPTPPAGPSQLEYMRAQVDSGVERLMRMQLWGPTWQAVVAQDPEKEVLTGGIWPHADLGSKGWQESDFSKMSKQTIKDEVTGHSVGSNNNWIRGLEILGRAYNYAGSKYYRSAEVLRRIVLGVDFYQLAQGHNGGFDPRPRISAGWIGAPSRRNASGCLEGYGHMGFSAAVGLIADALSDGQLLSEKVDADDTGEKTVTRRESWKRLLVNSRDYLQWNRGHAPNQDLADILAAQLADTALETVSPSSRIPRADMLRGAKQAVGILAQPSDDGPWKPEAGAGPVKSTDPGWWFSRSGISMEPNTNVNGGFSAGYGDEEWALGWLASLTGDEEVLAVARKHVQNFGRFRFPDTCRYNESSPAAVESTCMRLESAITWRHNKNPGTVSYGGGDAGAFMALNASEPTSIRLAQLWMQHAQAFTLELATDRATSSPHWPDDLADASIRLASFEALAALPPTAHRLPYAQQLSSRLAKV